MRCGCSRARARWPAWCCRCCSGRARRRPPLSGKVNLACESDSRASQGLIRAVTRRGLAPSRELRDVGGSASRVLMSAAGRGIDANHAPVDPALVNRLPAAKAGRQVPPWEAGPLPERVSLITRRWHCQRPRRPRFLGKCPQRPPRRSRRWRSTCRCRRRGGHAADGDRGGGRAGPERGPWPFWPTARIPPAPSAATCDAGASVRSSRSPPSKSVTACDEADSAAVHPPSTRTRTSSGTPSSGASTASNNGLAWPHELTSSRSPARPHSTLRPSSSGPGADHRDRT